MAETQAGSPAEQTPPEENGESWLRRNKKGAGIGATTLALALGGALAGAAVFSAGPGNAAGFGSQPDQLATSASRMPQTIGSLCASTHQTATAADTAIACQSVGIDSYRAIAYRAFSEQRAIAYYERAAALAAATPKVKSGSLPAVKARVPGISSLPKPKGLKLPATVSKKVNGTCVATPALPKKLKHSGLPTVTVKVPLGNSGTTSVSVGSKGAKLCTEKSSKTRKHKKTPSTSTTTTTTNPVQSVVNGVTGTVSGIKGGL